MSKKRRETSNYSSDMWKKQKIPSLLSQKDVEDVEVFFRKQYKYSRTLSQLAPDHGASGSSQSASAVEDWIGESPTLALQVSCDPELMALKEKLNATKDQLSGQDIETWHEHTTSCNIAAKIIPYVKSLKVELCTQAWVKFYEILSTYPIVPKQDFLSVHLCEAPGAFVASLNHYLQQHSFKSMWDWRATTLNPYYEANIMGEMIADDRLIRHTYSQWFFGQDDSGDITAKNHVRDLCSMLKEVVEDEEMSPLLVTADGSKDCQTNPAEQESSLTRLHYCEMISACLILAKGGNFVFKVFTMFEPATVALMFLLNIMFTQVHATKPATSKSGNSEMYLVCLNYRKNVQEKTLWKLLDLTVYNKVDGTVIFIKDFPDDVLHEHRASCQNFAQWQMQTIKHNIELFENNTPNEHRRLQEMQKLALEKFIQKTGISHISQIRRIVESYRDRSAFALKFTKGPHPRPTWSDWHHKNLKGTFQLRQNLSSMSWQDRIRLMNIRDNPQLNMLLQCEYTIQDDDISEWMDIEKGNTFSVIENSRLCDVDLMKDLTILLRNSQVKRCRQPLFKQHAAHLGQTLSGLVVESSSGTSTPLTVRQSVIYWVGGTEEQDSAVYKSFIENFKDTVHVKHIAREEDFAAMTSSSEQQVVVFCNVASFCDDNEFCSSNYEELSNMKKFMGLITKLLKHLPCCHRLILLTSTFLSRLTAGVLYILARSFHTIAMYGQANMWLHHFVVLDDFHGVSHALVDHLAEANKMIESVVSPGQITVMAVVKFSYLLNDRKFVQFVTACNNFIVTGFINQILQHYRSETREENIPAITSM